MYEEFPLDVAPDWGLSTEVKDETYEQALGDGYKVVRPKGINWLRESWGPSWSFLEPEEALETYQWLKKRLKITAFLWTHPLTKQVHRVKCTKVSYAAADVGICSLKATFEEDFNL